MAHSRAVRVLSYNMWHGGERSGLPLSATADAIRASGAHIIGLQGMYIKTYIQHASFSLTS